MPTYEYACTQCQHRLEKVQSFTEPALIECPACAGRLRKVFSPVGVVFKGSGFYRTDNRSTTKKPTSSATSSSTSSSDTSTTTSSSDTSTAKPEKASTATA